MNAVLILQLEAEYFLNDAKTSFGVATKSIGCAGTLVAESHCERKDQNEGTSMQTKQKRRKVSQSRLDPGALMEGQRYAGVLMVIPSTTVERSPIWIC